MNIKITREYEQYNFTPLRNLEIGKFFLYNNNIYVKTRMCLLAEDKCECLQFSNSMYCEPIYLDVNINVVLCGILNLKYYVSGK